ELVIESRVCHAHVARVPRFKRRAELVSIKADNVARRAIVSAAVTSGTRPAVTEMNRNDSIRLTRHDPEWRANGLSLLVGDVNARHVMLATLHGAADAICTSDLLSGVWTDDRDVVPRYFCQRFRQ